MSKIVTPKSILIEETALSLATTWYEIGRGQGLTSKHKDAKAYAKANLEKFIPNSVAILIDMLKPTSNCIKEMRDMIYEAFMERHNDPELLNVLPNVDVKKVLELAAETERKKPLLEIKTLNSIDKIVKDMNPSKKKDIKHG